MLRGASTQQNNTLDRQSDVQLIVSSRWLDIDRVVGVKSVEVVMAGDKDIWRESWED